MCGGERFSLRNWFLRSRRLTSDKSPDLKSVVGNLETCGTDGVVLAHM